MSPKKKSKQKNNESKRLDEFVETGHKLTQQELESHLWESANILRGSIDAADYKTYISRKNVQFIVDRGAYPRIEPKKRLRARSRGYRGYNELIIEYRRNHEEWKRVH